MRLFTAIDLPPTVRETFASLQAPHTLDAKWTSPDQFHVTLRFIGDADEEQAKCYEDQLSQIEAPPVECIPYGLDAFPSRRDPSVLIVGLERTEDMHSVYQSVSTALEAEGLSPEERTYRPHVTLARVGDLSAQTVHDFMDEQDTSSLPSFTADTFHLYESTLTSEGAVHNRRSSFPLNA